MNRILEEYRKQADAVLSAVCGEEKRMDAAAEWIADAYAAGTGLYSMHHASSRCFYRPAHRFLEALGAGKTFDDPGFRPRLET